MKILILHQHFNSPIKGGALRSYYLAKALIEKGFNTVVITAHNEPRYSIENVEGIEVHYLPISYKNKFGFYKRGMSFIRFVIGSVKLAGKIKDIDFCYAISVPLTVGLAAIWIKRLYKIPFIFEVGDLWPEAPVQLGFINHRVLRESLYSLEKKIYRNSQCVVALSPMIKNAIEHKVPEKKVVLLPNMADTQYYYPSAKNPMLEKKFGVEERFVVSYIGAVGFANGLDYYLECVRAAEKSELPIHFILCGEGAMLQHLKSVAGQLKLKTLSFIPFQNRDGVRDVMNVTDTSFICYRPEPVLETGSPNKYFDGLAAGKLIVINFKGWIKEEIEKEQCGVYIDSKQPTDFVKKITPFIESKSLFKQYSDNARMLAEKKYMRETLSQQFVSLFSK